MLKGLPLVPNRFIFVTVPQAEFEQKQMDMRDQVVRFEKFIQENDAKRARAEAKAKQVRFREQTLCPYCTPPGETKKRIAHKQHTELVPTLCSLGLLTAYGV